MSRRRRKNPSLRDVNSFVTIGLIVGGGYLFYKYVWSMLQKLPSPSAIADAVTAPVANAYVAATSGPTVASQLQGSVILSTGEQITVSDMQNTGTVQELNPGPGLSFVWNGSTYQITTPHDANGNYLATLVG